jgi:hypothetical protein
VRSAAGRRLLLVGLVVSVAATGLHAATPGSSRLTASGDPIEASLEAEQTHTFRIALEAGQFLEVIIEQLGADVVANTRDPNGQPLLEFDSPGSGEAPEPVYLLAELTGDHTIDVRAYKGSGGDYSIRVETLRAHEQIDRTRMTAEKAFIDGRVWRRNGDPESVRKALIEFETALGDSQGALELHERALEQWQSVGYGRGEGVALRDLAPWPTSARASRSAPYNGIEKPSVDSKNTDRGGAGVVPRIPCALS